MIVEEFQIFSSFSVTLTVTPIKAMKERAILAPKNSKNLDESHMISTCDMTDTLHETENGMYTENYEDEIRKEKNRSTAFFGKVTFIISIQ